MSVDPDPGRLKIYTLLKFEIKKSIFCPTFPIYKLLKWLIFSKMFNFFDQL